MSTSADPDYRITSLPVDPAARRPLLPEVRRLRAQAYAAHRPEVAALMLRPDPVDERPGTVVLVARDRVGQAVGTIRLTSRADGPLPLEAEPDLDLPAGLLDRDWFEVARYCVDAGFRPEAAAPVGILLIKAAYLVLQSRAATGALVAARGAMAERFTGIGYREPTPGLRIRLGQLGGLEHQVLALRLGVDDATLIAQQHPFAHFVLHTEHREIDLTALERTETLGQYM